MNSNHSIVVAKLVTGILKKTKRVAADKHLKGKRKVLKLDKAQKENWERYREKLEDDICKSLESLNNIEAVKEKCRNKSIDKI